MFAIAARLSAGLRFYDSSQHFNESHTEALYEFSSVIYVLKLYTRTCTCEYIIHVIVQISLKMKNK